MLHQQKSAFSFPGRAFVGTVFALFIATYFLFALFVNLNMGPAEGVESKIGATPEGEVEAAMASLSREEIISIRRSEREKLLARPLDITTLKRLSYLNERAGETGLAENYAIIAGRRSMRDSAAQLFLIQKALGSKSYDEALYRLDGLVRAHSRRGTESFKRFDDFLRLIADLVKVPEARKAIASQLAKTPPWRKAFLKQLVSNSSSPVSTIYALFVEMRETSHPPNTEETKAVYDRLIKEGNFELAHYMWLNFLTDEKLAKSEMIFDGSFDLPPSNDYFGWNAVNSANVRAAPIRSDANPNDKILSLEISASPKKFDGLFQYLRLSPGSYKLALDARITEIDTESDLTWQIYCVPGNGPIGELEGFAEKSQWKRLEVDFRVPDQNCETQLLKFAHKQIAKPPFKLTGRLQFDNFKITALPSN